MKSPAAASRRPHPRHAARSSQSRWSAGLEFIRRHSAAEISALYLLVVVFFSFHYLAVGLSRSWFYSSDEYVFAAEIIRFLHLDPHQYYFDMPGTPYMVLSAILWALFRPVAGWIGMGYPTAGIIDFTYQHLDWFFTLLRAETLIFYECSLVLIFILARKLLNTPAAFVATLILMMSPAYANYSSFSRVESMSICLVLAALMLVYRALAAAPGNFDARPSWRDPMIRAGVLCGIASAARLHSMMASGALLFLIMLCDPRVQHREHYPKWILGPARFVLPLISVGSFVFYWMVKWHVTAYPFAARLLEKTAIALILAPPAAVLLYRITSTRPILVRAMSPPAMKLGIGGLCGFVATNPLMFPQYTHFLESINVYTGFYNDLERTKWPLWMNLKWYVAFYTHVFAPDTLLLLLFAAAAVWIAVSRDRRFLPYILTVFSFFISKPINLMALPHHAILWLPLFALACAYPAAKAYDAMRGPQGARRTRKIGAVIAIAAAFAAIALTLTNGPAKAAEYARLTQVRLENVGKATDWIHANTPMNSTVAIGYWCFNPDVFYTRMEEMRVPLPNGPIDPRRHIVWWGHREQLSGIAGYLCTSQTARGGTLPYDQLAPTDPAHLVDPYAEPGFQRVASFGRDTQEVDVFRFDLRDTGH